MLLAASALLPVAAQAQVDQGTIAGLVQDNSGAVVAGAQVRSPILTPVLFCNGMQTRRHLCLFSVEDRQLQG